MTRRTILGALGCLLLGACSGAPPVPPKTPLSPLATGDLAGLIPAPGLAYLVLLKPREIAQIPWLIPSIGSIAPEENLNRFRAQTGLDLRRITEAVLVHFGEAFEGADLQLVRHDGKASAIEKLFQKRLVKGAHRTEDRADVIRLSGQIGTHGQALARLGDDVVAFQEGGSLERGPARVAALFATGRLKKTPRALDVEPLKSLRARFGNAPVIALAKGPFQDEWKRGARGLLEAATGIGAAARPTAREHIGFAIALSGDFQRSGAAASEVLLGAWDDFASSEMGHLLGLDRPIERPLATFSDDAISVNVEIEPNRFVQGLKALVTEDLDAIMKL